MLQASQHKHWARRRPGSKDSQKGRSSKPEKDRKPISWKAWKGPDGQGEDSVQPEKGSKLGDKAKERSSRDVPKHGEREISRKKDKEDREYHRRSPPLHSRRQITRKRSPPPRGRSPGPRRRSPFPAARHRDSYSPPHSRQRSPRRRSPVILRRCLAIPSSLFSAIALKLTFLVVHPDLSASAAAAHCSLAIRVKIAIDSYLMPLILLLYTCMRAHSLQVTARESRLLGKV